MLPTLYLFLPIRNLGCGVKISGYFYHSDLREINFEDSRSAKSAILTHLEALNFDFHEILHFLKGLNLPHQQSSGPGD